MLNFLVMRELKAMARVHAKQINNQSVKIAVAAILVDYLKNKHDNLGKNYDMSNVIH